MTQPQCTAPKQGHGSAAAAAVCPVHGTSVDPRTVLPGVTPLPAARAQPRDVPESIYERRDVASNTMTHPDLLDVLLTNIDADTVRLAAANPSLSSDSLTLASELSEESAAGAALNPLAPPKMLASLAKHRARAVREAVAKNPHTPPRTLSVLAKDDNGQVRVEVARNPSTPVKTLDALSHDMRTWATPAIVAGNPSASSKTLYRLAKSPDLMLREHLARNPSAPTKVLARLADADAFSVRREVARNPSTPVQVIERFARMSDDSLVLYAVESGRLSPETLRRLSKHRDDSVRVRVADDPSTPVDVLAVMWDDSYTVVASSVARNPSTSSETLSDVMLRSHNPGAVSLALDAATERIRERFGVGEDNREAVTAIVRLDDWWARDSDDEAVQLIRLMHPNR